MTENDPFTMQQLSKTKNKISLLKKWLGWGFVSIGDPSKAIRVGVGALKKKPYIGSI